MALQLPLELQNEILSRLPPQSLVRLRSVCKQWNSLLKDKSFVNNYLSRTLPQLIFHTNCKAYLIDVIDLDPNSIGRKIDLRDLPSFDLPLQDKIKVMRTCDEFLFCIYERERRMGLLNPLLKHVKWFEYDYKQFFLIGLGYDNSRSEKAYKVLGIHYGSNPLRRTAIYDCASQVFKFIDPVHDIVWHVHDGLLNVCLNGNLYWVSNNRETGEHFIQSFDFSMEAFKPFCLPCKKSHYEDGHALEAFKADSLSLLKLSYRTKEIEIWVTDKTINREEKDVVWIKLMTLPATILPRPYTLLQRISYLIYDKTLFMCCKDYMSRFAYIYIVREDLFKRIKIDTGIAYCRHSFYTPNFISVPYFRG